MEALLPLPVIIPLATAALSILVGRWRAVQRLVGCASLAATTAISVALLVRADAEGPAATQLGGWEAPVGITLVADRFAGIMLVIASVMLLAVLVYAIGEAGAERDHVGFHPIYQVLAAGVGAAFLTGDLFNLFVAFEMMLTASYVLLTLGGNHSQVRSGMTYVVISLVASALFLTAVALIYTATGTVNMADLAGRLGDLDQSLRLGFGLLLLVVFGIKAAVFPLFFWLPDSYPTAPSPVTAVFAGLLTKVGVYAIIRTQTLLLPAGERPSGLVLAIAGVTMAVGVLGAIAQDDIKRILSFHIVSQIGYMIMGLGLFSVAGVAAAVLYIVHHIVVKTTLFLVGGLVEHTSGTLRLARVDGLARRFPLLGVLFLVPALSLAGIPPFSGFVAKFALVDAGLAGGAGVVVAVSLAVSLLTLFSMTKIWTAAFWGELRVPGEPAELPARPGAWPMLAPVLVLVVLSVVIAGSAGPLYELSTRAAEGLIDPSAYVGEVLG